MTYELGSHRHMAMQLAGRVAIVTGGGRGIGRSIAQVFATAGAAVAIVSRSENQVAETVALIQASGGRVLGLSADVTRWDSVQQTVERTEQTLGPVGILVNNAGSMLTIAPIWEADPQKWWRDVEVTLCGTFLCTRAVLPGMIARRYGTIINLSGGRATCPSPAISAYISAKTAVVRFTECLAAEAREYGIRAYAMGPGLVVTQLTKNLMNTAAGQKWQPTVSARVAAGENVPPERSAELALFLAAHAGLELSGRLIEVYDDIGDLTQRGPEIERSDLHVLRVGK